uniref:Lipopolysaccharide-binding protein n=1 Tax=Panagrolaimus sp. JU765 TaxID=591449 RepID=A0AC34PW93_9BILA
MMIFGLFLLFVGINGQQSSRPVSPLHPQPNKAQQLTSDQLVSPLLFQNTDPLNAGIYLRLMPTGLAYLREIGMKVVNDEVLKISLPTITETIDAGQVSIFNAYVSKYWPPVEYSLDLVAPNTFTWTMSKMHLRASGEFEARINGALLLPTVPIRGQFETLLGHISLTISVRQSRSALGAPQVQSVYCNTQIGYVDLNVRNTGVLTDFFINSFKAFLIAHFKPTVEQRMCQMIEKIVNQDMNSILSTMPLKIRINENNLDIIGQTFGISQPTKLNTFETKGNRNLTLFNFVNQLRERNLILDFSLLDEPNINQGTILMKSKGEISWGGIGGTPFFPPNVNIPSPHGVHMVEFYGTDYIANSMLYHAFRQKYMDVTVGPESSPQLKDLLQTSCPTGFCLGEYLGALGEQFPNRQVEIRFTAKKAPVMVFVENRARFRLHGRIGMFVRPQNSSQVKLEVIRSDTTMTANVNLWIQKQHIVGNASIENLDFKLIDSRIEDVDQAVFNDLGLFGAEFLEKLLTEILQMGLIMPTMKGVILKSPKLTIHDRYIRVQTYFKLDEQYAERLVQGAVRQTLHNVG